jgi:hypothetical protein
MTSMEKREIVERLLVRYAHIGTLLVRDDDMLCRLFIALDVGGKDREVGNYLRSFLTV